jgi:hypothetical protein
VPLTSTDKLKLCCRPYVTQFTRPAGLQETEARECQTTPYNHKFLSLFHTVISGSDSGSHMLSVRQWSLPVLKCYRGLFALSSRALTPKFFDAVTTETPTHGLLAMPMVLLQMTDGDIIIVTLNYFLPTWKSFLTLNPISRFIACFSHFSCARLHPPRDVPPLRASIFPKTKTEVLWVAPRG